MRKVILAGVLALGLLGVASVPPARSVDSDAVKAAIARGVAFLQSQQRQDGTWPPEMKDLSFANLPGTAVRLGATALAGLTLLECGVGADDRSVAAAAEAVRKAGPGLTHTYALALSILFLDRFGNPADLPLIESMAVRLLAGQQVDGGWGYSCPPISAEEVARLSNPPRESTELVGRRELPKPGGPRRAAKDLSPEIQQQVALINRRGPYQGDAPGAILANTDNSNTQFAILALWVARRYGIPVETALDRINKRFRSSQGADGGWGYNFPNGPPGMAMMGGMGSTATMTCGGILGLLVVHGTVADLRRETHGKPIDIDKDPNLLKALQALSTAIDRPVGDSRDREIPRAGGKSYYFLWSLERVCVILGLETLDKKDWYSWGAEILLANQQRDGSWRGEFAEMCADTCFALLFLNRSNLARDLSASLKGQFKDPGATLRARGLGGKALKEAPPPKLKAAIEGKNAAKTPDTRGPGGRPTEVKAPAKNPPAESDSARLADELVKAPPTEQGALLQKLQETRGVDNTEALAFAIPRLEGETKQKAREALTARLARLKAESLMRYLEDEDSEIRRAAALACAVKKLKTAVPKLIPRLGDRDEGVKQAALTALKDLSGQDLGNSPEVWEAWWKKQGEE